MRNFVIINGVNSNTINGLGINELPPITKPEMRNIREEIDGRDGDITTNLGYSAYDKTITIGLFGTGYDINNIVAFFNGEGTIVFSNEPDKYYNFKILNQIDYESLQKFRTASITFHCQPFKYPLSETPKEIEPNIKTLSNVESANITASGISTLKLDLKGNTSQSGTPTPTSPIPISVVSGDNDVVVCGKNLFDKDNANIVVNKYLNSSGVETSDGSFSISDYIEVQPSTTYSLTPYRNTGACLCYYDNSKTLISSVSLYTINPTFTTPNNCKYVRFSIWKANIDITQLEKGSATPYEPYQSQTYEVDLGTLELCKIGTYQDYFTKNSDGEWCKYNAIGKYTFDGTETWYRTGTKTSGNYYFFANDVLNNVKFDSNNKFTGMSNMGISTNIYQEIQGTDTIFYDNTNRSRFYSEATKTMSAPDFKVWLSTNNTTVYYVLNTPYLSLIEDNNLIEQLDNLENATSYEGTTNINQVNNDKAFLMDVDYLEQGTDEVVVNNIGNIYSKPLLALEGNGNVDIYLDNTQILKANVESKMNIDIAQLEAYNPDTSALLNRQVIGNYNSMTLQPGNNTIRIDGALDKATISNYTRWL